MDGLFTLVDPTEFAVAAAIGLFAGFVKGVVGFALPLLLLSGLTMFLSPELALAALIIPTLITNVYQALRNGLAAALDSVKQFRVFLVVGGVCLVIAAQFVRVVPDHVMLLMIGALVTLSALLLISGFSFRVGTENATKFEAIVAVVAGTIGGISATWGPPTVAYLTAINTPKQDQMRIQGVIYGLGAICLTVAHSFSGVLRSETIGFSAAMVGPVVVGVWLGAQVMDRIDQQHFRRITLVVLILAGLNMMRRGVVG